MGAYYLKAESPIMARIQRGRKTIGYVHKQEKGWRAKAGEHEATGTDAVDAFRKLVRVIKEANAKTAGFDNYEAQLAAHNASVRAEVAAANANCVALGLPPMYRVRKRRT